MIQRREPLKACWQIRRLNSSERNVTKHNRRNYKGTKTKQILEKHSLWFCKIAVRLFFFGFVIFSCFRLKIVESDIQTISLRPFYKKAKGFPNKNWKAFHLLSTEKNPELI